MMLLCVGLVGCALQAPARWVEGGDCVRMTRTVDSLVETWKCAPVVRVGKGG